MRKLSELLELVKNNLDMLKKGLCHLVQDLEYQNYLTNDEYYILKIYLKKQFPAEKGIYKAFGDHKPYYHFPVGEVEPRRIWLESKIEELKIEKL